MRTVLEEFVHDRDMFSRYADAGIELYSAASPNINPWTAEEREAELLEFIGRSQKRERFGTRPVDAARALGWTHGAVTRCLRSLCKKRCLVKRTKGPAARYRVRSTGSSQQVKQAAGKM
jgi:DNA-binding MarR family transcriptional regulator